MYDRRFFDSQRDDSLRSARAMVPFFVETFRPQSVLDLGCGVGTWLAAFQESGVSDVLGVDGPWVVSGELTIDSRRFVAADVAGPVALGRRFDLVLSLEVAEHLSPQAADRFVQNLVDHGDVVIFSAAIPFQGGSDHRNEQWPRFWAEKFRTHGFACHDVVRMKFWEDPRVSYYYVQNSFVYAKEPLPQPLRTRLADLASPTARGSWPVALVHPDKFVKTASLEAVPLRRILRALPGSVLRAVRRRWQA